MVDVLTVRWRVGRKMGLEEFGAPGRTIYAMVGPEPSDDDVLLGMMDDVYLAEHVVAVHNASLS